MPDEHEVVRASGPGRRAVVKTGTALVVGLALGSGYVRPGLTSVELVEVAYASGNPVAVAPGAITAEGTGSGGGKGKGKGR
jgi:hypothetical protein